MSKIIMDSDESVRLTCGQCIIALTVSVLLVGCGRSDNVGDQSPMGVEDKSTSEQFTAAASEDISRIVQTSPLNPQTDKQWEAARFSTAGRIERAVQRAGDVEKGRLALLQEAYVSCGLPERVFRQLSDSTEVVEAPGRTARASGLPYSANVTDNADGVPIVSSNCLTCHGTVLFGDLVIGLGQ